MREGPDISRTAALIGDPARAHMLVALADGGARTVSELAAEAGIGLPTASAHLAKLEAGGLVMPRKEGRHRYYALASEEAGLLIEQLLAFSAASRPAARTRPGPRDPELRRARVCYNHLAGERGVQMYDSLIRRGFLMETTNGMGLTDPGWAFAEGLGLTPADFARHRPPLCRACLDWSVRRSHLGGRLGRALLTALEGRGWVMRVPQTRILRFSRAGEAAFDRLFPCA
ncbi:helix-turn-helix transcriptional regulator [Frigidibacter sp. SD6-1]|uniref:ArsR/SmtB family transcription factor n=1 Tax=Frigidibacter sp. SD6-1 TaxID=3032581 RepID=UPI0024DF4666|nr:helix-turn-helix transcriptional regulator [Frigidibacter sp. SD6-1]